MPVGQAIYLRSSDNGTITQQRIANPTEILNTFQFILVLSAYSVPVVTKACCKDIIS